MNTFTDTLTDDAAFCSPSNAAKDHVFLDQLQSVFSDSWFTEDQLGSCFAAALKPVAEDSPPHLSGLMAVMALHDLAADGLPIEASRTCPGNWRVRNTSRAQSW